MSATIAHQLRAASDEALAIVDADLHVYPADEDALAAYLPERFRGKGVFAPRGNWSSPIEPRGDAVPDDGPAGSDPAVTRERHLDALGIEHAIVTGGGLNLAASTLPEKRYAAAVTSAYNDWLLDTWLGTDDRLRGSISVASIAPEAAAEEIHRLADHPDMVQVIMGGATQIPLGQERYWPIYEAAEAEGLPVALHVGTEGYGVANPNSGAGYPTTYLERRSVYPSNFMGQLLSLVLEGVFVEFPDLRIVLVGGGYSWFPAFVWRIDKCWKGLTHDVPWVERPPSEYVREHVRFATHPLDEAGDPDRLNQMLEMAHAEETLLFASNYPHWDSYAPGDALPELAPALERAIFSENATELYGL